MSLTRLMAGDQLVLILTLLSGLPARCALGRLMCSSMLIKGFPRADYSFWP